MPQVEDYGWSSYRERMLGSTNNMLDEDACYLGLGSSALERNARYRAFVKARISKAEQKFIADSVNRNQLTGNNRFIDEIEQRVGIRIERRGRGRPKNAVK